MFDPNTLPWERNYSMAIHLSILAGHFMLPIVPAVVMYMMKKGESPFVADHGREAINFQISVFLYALLSTPLMFVCGIGFVVLVAVYVLTIVGLVFAAVAANKSKYFRYPATIRFLKG